MSKTIPLAKREHMTEALALCLYFADFQEYIFHQILFGPWMQEYPLLKIRIARLQNIKKISILPTVFNPFKYGYQWVSLPGALYYRFHDPIYT